MLLALTVVAAFGAGRAGSTESSHDKGVADQPTVLAVVDAAAGLPLISPISIVSIFGDFARATAVSTSVPLNFDFDGLTVKFDGRPAALLGVFDDVLVDGTVDQVNVQVPVDLDVSGGMVEVEVEWQDESGKGASAVFEVAAAPASPGIFEAPPGRAIVTNFSLGDDDVIDGSWAHTPDKIPFPVDAQPAAVGGVIIIWCSGLGPVIQPGGQPPLETGNIPPAGALFVSKEIFVAIDGKPANVIGAALQGSNVGLYQINAFVPEIDFEAGQESKDVEVVIEVICDDNTIVASKTQSFISVRPKPAAAPSG